MYWCRGFNSTDTLFHILHSVYVVSEYWVFFEFSNILVLNSPVQFCFLNNTSHVQAWVPNSLSQRTVFTSLCNTRVPGAFRFDKATLLGVCVPFCTGMVFLLATVTVWLKMQHRQYVHFIGEWGELSKIMKWKTSKKIPFKQLRDTHLIS